ncbi:TPA: hypothetical protein JI239_19520 [Acinetobacter baumannii]|uniref:MobA/VirD2-like nuclease domain-containing protein n=3 Tax=Gammaproteobacteria TaxID=1236 RepID=A0A371YJ31_9GAMM|nr:relaxase/mobilization nuclease domain-containing protein [Acinetobacter sichuanensis]RFC81483.1 hypothetical protein C9E89_021595 [Acinetobacter sichuanensis]HAV6035707.1 hypothetical protein [Acinetobacter baumannii]
MIIKIHSRGSGSGSGPVDYLLGKYRDREEARLDRGDPEQMVQLIDSTHFAQKYTSGVLSFAERDLEEHQKQKIMDSFERTLLPGLDKDQYSILWVQHLDKDRLELNFVVANVELQSGKRLQPYYDKADRPRLNAWKDLVNDHYKLHDPNDPLNKRELCTPNNLPKAKEAAAHAITDGLLNIAESGNLKNRDDVISMLENAGFEIARKTPKSISIKDPEGGRNIRLKGKIYEQDFRFGQELRADIEAASARYRADRGERIEAARKTLNRLTERKRESHEYRYPRAKLTDTPDYIKKLDDRINRYRYSDSPSMGRSDVSELQNKQEFRANYSTESSYPRTQEQRGERAVSGLYRPEEPQATMRISEQGSRNLEERQSYGSDGVLSDDRIRKAIARSTGTDAGTAAGERRGFTADVQEYTARKSAASGEIKVVFSEFERYRSDSKRKLEQISTASKQLDYSIKGLQDAKRTLDQAITSIRDTSQKLEKMNQPKRSYGIRY